jgi:two-component system chemotaxis response regulator CheB
MIPTPTRQPRPLPDLREIDVIVIGGSAGSFQVLNRLLPSLPRSVPAVVVVHVPPGRVSPLAEVLGASSGRSTVEAMDKAPLNPGVIHFAPPDYHLLLEADKSFALSVDPPVHFSRPAIDVLFESAVDAFGARVLGVVLTGANEDGAAGLKAIHEAGGYCIVQRPDTAEAPSMPLAAIHMAAPDRVLSIEEMVALFQQLEVPLARGGDPGGSHA